MKKNGKDFKHLCLALKINSCHKDFQNLHLKTFMIQYDLYLYEKTLFDNNLVFSLWKL